MPEKKSNLQEIFARKKLCPSVMDLGELRDQCLQGDYKSLWAIFFERLKQNAYLPEELMHWASSELPISANGKKEGVEFFDPDFREFPIAVTSHLVMGIEAGKGKWEAVVEHLQFLDERRRLLKEENYPLKIKRVLTRRINVAEQLIGIYFTDEVITYRGA